MTPFNRFFLSVLGLGALLAGPSAKALTLPEAYQAALRRSENIGTQIELIRQAEENYRQAIGNVLPQINGTASYLLQEQPAGFATISPPSQPLVKLTLTQPLFQGFREFAAMRQLKNLTGSQRQQRKQAEKQLLSDTSTSFFTVLSLEKQLLNLNDEVSTYEARIKDLQEWFRIGRSRSADLLTTQSQLASLRSQIASVQGTLSAQRETFAFLTGMAAETPVQDTFGVVQHLDDLGTFLLRRDQRPEVQSAQHQFLAATEVTKSARGAYLPTVNLIADYYFKRYGIYDSVHWDIQGVLTIPIFTAGVLDSKLQVARSQEAQAELTVSLNKRQVEQDIRTQYKAVQADRAQRQELDSASELSERSFKENVKDYRRGLVTNLDVLTSLTTYEQAKISLDNIGYMEKLDYIKLQAAAGMSDLLPAEKALD